MSTNQIKFSTNWNNKLAGKAFTTIRLGNNRKYVKGKLYTILLKDKTIKKALIEELFTFELKDMNNTMSFLDTGYCLAETKEIMRKMYPFIKNKPKTKFMYILLVTQNEK